VRVEYPTGTLLNETLRSRALIKTLRQHIYLPPHYEASARRYPVVYLLHPWGEDERFWTGQLRLHEVADRLIGLGALPPFIAVMPQGDKSFFINAEDPGGDFSPVLRLDPEHFDGALDGFGDYGDYLLHDVVNMVEQRFAARTDRPARIIAGVGMGAAGAAVLAFTHPRFFGAAGIHSPTLFTDERLGPPWIFGLGDPLAFEKRSPVHLAGRLDPRRSDLRIYLDCGQDDEMSGPTEALHDVLAAHGLPHTYVSRPGPAGPDYWQEHLPGYLGFYAAGW
jgi:enterochelin esterase-like enzyme